MVQSRAAWPVRCRLCARHVRLLRHGSRCASRGDGDRHRVFDAPGSKDAAGQEPTLVGQEELQSEILPRVVQLRPWRVAQSPRPDARPNGSSKSTAASCVLRGLEHYSSLEEGALYRFHWNLPEPVKGKGTIGFRYRHGPRTSSTAMPLDEDESMPDWSSSLRDHPLFLVPLAGVALCSTTCGRASSRSAATLA